MQHLAPREPLIVGNNPTGARWRVCDCHFGGRCPYECVVGVGRVSAVNRSAVGFGEWFQHQVVFIEVGKGRPRGGAKSFVAVVGAGWVEHVRLGTR